jgi:hypothetical protein
VVEKIMSDNLLLEPERRGEGVERVLKEERGCREGSWRRWRVLQRTWRG